MPPNKLKETTKAMKKEVAPREEAIERNQRVIYLENIIKNTVLNNLITLIKYRKQNTIKEAVQAILDFKEEENFRSKDECQDVFLDNLDFGIQDLFSLINKQNLALERLDGQI